MTVRKGIILAAGFGTRFLPASKAVPKEMLPLLDRPVIQHIVEEAVAAGIQELVIVTSLGKEVMASHFARVWELEEALAAKGDEDRLETVRRLASLGSLAFVYQKERLGTGHALLQARWLLADGPFALFYPDDIVVSDRPAIGQLIEAQARWGGHVLGVAEVPREEVHRYGVIDPEPLGDGVFRVRRTVEKPAPEEAPSALAIVGRLVLTPEVFPVLEATPVGKGGEVWLTDALATLCGRGAVYARCLEGEWLDTGNPLGLLKASLSLAMRDPRTSGELRPYLERLLETPPS